MNSPKLTTIDSICKYFLFFIFSASFLIAQNKDIPYLSKGAAAFIEQYSKMNINNISTFIYNTGRADHSLTGDSGFEFPNNSGKTLVYESGLLWCAVANGQIRSGGSSYNSGLTPGKILLNGKPDDPASPAVRVFRVRPDYRTGDLSTEINDENKDQQTIYNQYEKDWNEWPASSGAPFKDINGNGIYEPSVDIPGVPDADQTIWFAANDFDSTQTKKLYGSLPMGIEMQTTVWAYKNVDPLNNMIFKRHVVINKSNIKFEEMYFGIWSDPDVGGDAGDNLVGCDTLLNLGYCYNGDDSDPSYGSSIPSLGFSLLQGPVTNGTVTDVAKFMGKELPGKKNLSMSSFSWVAKTPRVYADPTLNNYSGTLQLYNFMQGKLNDGTPFPNPLTGGTTKLPLSGDPITQQGFVGGKLYSTGWEDRKHDRRMMVCCGPFNMAAGDTQEVIFAQIAGGGNLGESRLAAVSLLKKSVRFAQKMYKENFNPPKILLPLPAPLAAELDREIILSWGNDIETVKGIENAGSSFYSFQGYNVYQISKNETTLGEKKLIAAFDKKDNRQSYLDEEVDPLQGYVSRADKGFGSDSGIQRFISIKKDYLNEKPLNNGSDYDFCVSYFYLADEYDFPYSYLESPVSTATVKPQSPKPGFYSEIKFGDLIAASHIAGNSGAEIKALILDPVSLTGHEYEIGFNIVNGKKTFNLTNITTDKILLTDQSNLSGDNDLFITDGFLLRVKDNPVNPVNVNDLYRFTTSKIVYNEELAADDVGKINVFPNPYYGGGGNEFNKYDRHVTFSHLPQRAVIRIFNLAGALVRKIDKDSPDQFIRWNMLTENYFQVPGGIYIVHIELPDLGRIKILKLALFTAVFIPDHF